MMSPSRPWIIVQSDKGHEVFVNPVQVKAVFDLGEKRKVDMGSSYVYTESSLDDLADLLDT